MAKFPYAGDLRHSIILQTKSSVSTDTGGGFTNSWANTRTLFAKISPVNGNNPYTSGRIEHDLTHDIYTRYYSNVDYSSGGARMRISWSDSGVTRTFSVKYVITINERDRFFFFRTSEGKANDS